jgi:hypothetical protein
MSRRRKLIDPGELTRLWNSEMLIQAIADHFEVSSPTLRIRARELGLSRNKPPKKSVRMKGAPRRLPTNLTYSKVEELVATGLTYKQALCKFHRQRA